MLPVRVGALHAQSAPTLPPLAPACGADDTSFKMKADGMDDEVAPPPGKALVYVIELMPRGLFLTTHVKVGADGQWLGQLNGQTFLHFAVDPGVHHLCASYQGSAAGSELGAPILHKPDAQAGKTYYLLYRSFITKDAGQVGFFDLVDEDEGRFALQFTHHLSATAVKK